MAHEELDPVAPGSSVPLSPAGVRSTGNNAISQELQLQSDLLEEEPGLGHPEGSLLGPFGDLVGQHEDLERKISSLHIELLAHKKLPPELLAKIFLFCSPPTVALPPRDEPLLTVSQTCRLWRDLVFNVPELWASISVSFTEQQNNVADLTDLSVQWLSRAGRTYPLSVTAECTGTYATTVCENPGLVAAFISMVISHAPRLRGFDLAFPMAALLPLFELPRGAFPRLERMSLRPLLRPEDVYLPDTGHCAWHWPSTTHAFDAAPLVGEITFVPRRLLRPPEPEEDIGEAVATPTLDRHLFFAPTFSLPWSQLSVLCCPCTALTADAWCAVLAECTKLASFEVAIKPSGQSLSSREDPIELHSLTLLSVVSPRGGGEELIQRLVTPSLTRLCLAGRPVSATCLIDFQVRSGFALQFVGFDSPYPADDVEHLLHHFSDITSLRFLFTTDHFPLSFWQRLGRGEFSPQLEVLSVRPTVTHVPVVADMIIARWKAGIEGSVPDLFVGFCDVRPAHVPAINDELRRLEKYAGGGRAIVGYNNF